MLQAEKNALESDLAQKVIALQHKELQLLHDNLLNLCTICTLLLASAFSAMTYILDHESTAHNWVVVQCIAQIGDKSAAPVDNCTRQTFEFFSNTAVLVTTVAALAYNLVALFIAVLTAMSGPGLALRGPEGSMTVALTSIEVQYQQAVRYFGRGMTAFVFALLSFGVNELCRLSPVNGIVLLAMGCWTAYKILWHGAQIGKRFQLANDVAVRGDFSEESLRRPAENAMERSMPGEEWPTDGRAAIQALVDPMGQIVGYGSGHNRGPAATDTSPRRTMLEAHLGIEPSEETVRTPSRPPSSRRVQFQQPARPRAPSLTNVLHRAADLREQVRQRYNRAGHNLPAPLWRLDDVFGCPYAEEMGSSAASSSRQSMDMRARDATHKQAAGLIHHMQPKLPEQPPPLVGCLGPGACDSAATEASSRGARRTRISLVRGKRASRPARSSTRQEPQVPPQPGMAEPEASLVSNLSGMLAGNSLSVADTPF